MEATIRNRRKRILVVDDNVSDTQLVKRYLEQNHNYVVREENDSRAALSAAEDFQPQLILLDVLMPDIDGGELAASFKAHAKLKTVPIVFLTSKLTREEVARCGGRIGGYPFLAKPIVLMEVADCLKRHLET